MVDSINRFLEHPQADISRHIVDAFGTDEAIEIARRPGDRIKGLRILYQRQLKRAAIYVRYFEMRDRNDRTQYYLFFATNNPLGHVKIKEAMWRVDRFGEFKFSDATDPNQMILIEPNRTDALVDLLRKEFSGRGRLTCKEIGAYVENETVFLKNHMRQVLKDEEEAERIIVEKNKTDGSRRRTKTFPDNAIIVFVE